MNRLVGLAEKTQAIFLEQFGAEPTTLVQAPGRVNLIGEHTDYNDGFVLPCAIDFQTLVCAAPRTDNLVRVVAADFDLEIDRFNLDQDIIPSSKLPWANYVRGTVKHLQQHGHQLLGADLVISGTVPQGAGLSSSASLEVAIAQTFKSLYELDLEPQNLALIAQEAENRFVGCNCGIMDQLIAVKGEAGSALLLDCRSLETRSIRIPEELAIVIINSNVTRGLIDSAYNLRRQQCEQAAHHFQVKALRDLSIETFETGCGELDPVIAKRARHVISENSRVLAAADALSTADTGKLSRLMAESHVSMREDFEITVPAIDTIVELVNQIIGSEGGVRMTGGGFGGCVVALVPLRLVADVCARVGAQYQARTGIRESIYICQAAAGAGEIIQP